MSGEQRTVLVGGKIITYTLIRKRIKNMHLRVTNDGEVVLSGPLRLTVAVADKFVSSNENYLSSRMKKIVEENGLISLSDGETITKFGKKYKVVCRKGRRSVYIEGNNIIVSTPNGTEEEKRGAFDKYIKAECGRVFFYYVEKYYPYFKKYVGDNPPVISLRNASTRWGSCTPSKKRIMLSLRLFSKPVEAIECVVVHEYCHFIHLNHSRAFYAEMEKILPDRKKREKFL